MKKLLIVTAGVLFLLLLGAGCANTDGAVTPSDTGGQATASTSAGTSSDKPDESTAPSNTGLPEDEQKAVLTAFQTLLKSPGIEKEALSVLREKAALLSPENASQMVLYFETYQDAAVTQGTIVSEELVKLIPGGTKEPYNEKTLNDLSSVTSPELKNALQALFDRGYKLIIPEGNYQATVDYNVYREFKPYVTPDVSAYIDIAASESDSRALEDAALIIPVNEIYTRAVACDAFLETYPDSAKAERVKWLYNNFYVLTYFYGQNNTPAFAYDTNKLDQEFLDSYEKTAASGSGTRIAKATAEYLKVLEENSYKLTEAVKTYRDKLVSDLKYTLA